MLEPLPTWFLAKRSPNFKQSGEITLLPIQNSRTTLRRSVEHTLLPFTSLKENTRIEPPTRSRDYGARHFTCERNSLWFPFSPEFMVSHSNKLQRRVPELPAGPWCSPHGHMRPCSQNNTISNTKIRLNFLQRFSGHPL